MTNMTTVKTKTKTVKKGDTTTEENEYDIPEVFTDLLKGLLEGPVKANDAKTDALKRAVAELYERQCEDAAQRRVRAFHRRIGLKHWSEDAD